MAEIARIASSPFRSMPNASTKPNSVHFLVEKGDGRRWHHYTRWRCGWQGAACLRGPPFRQRGLGGLLTNVHKSTWTRTLGKMLGSPAASAVHPGTTVAGLLKV